MATRKTPGRRPAETPKRKTRQRAAASVATSLDLQAAVRAAVREVMTPDAQMKPSAALGPAAAPLDAPSPGSPATAMDNAIGQASMALDELTMTVKHLTERLERSVLAPGPIRAADAKGETTAAMGASPVLHQITSLHARIRHVTECVHDIGNRLEA